MKDHNNRLKKMILWIKDEYPTYYTDGIVALTDEQKINKAQYHTTTHDFIYTGLNVSIIKAFMSGNKYKQTTVQNIEGEEPPKVQYSYSHIRKYQDAILFGAGRAKQALPQEYDLDMKQFLDSLKKEKVKAKKRGELDEQEADPISYPLYRLICMDAITRGDLFTWAFSVFQWSCMARSINIDDLTFKQLSLAKDSLVVKYCDSKADQKGEKTSPKNCYANPLDPAVCIFTALGCFLCLNDESWASEKDTIFRSKGAMPGSASHSYCKKLRDWFIDKADVVKEFVRPGHACSHGTRKGSAIEASSGTTLPASIAAIANRGEWSISMIFDVYLGFAEPGDHYLGRLLAVLNPNKASFASLPPHFIKGMEDKDVKEAMDLCFTSIIRNENENNVDISLNTNVCGLLLRCLASMVHHSDSLMQQTILHPNHPFASIPIFNRPILLSKLKKLVTTNPSDKITSATGIPPHIETIKIRGSLCFVKCNRPPALCCQHHLLVGS